MNLKKFCHTPLISYHCIHHQEALCEMVLKLDDKMATVNWSLYGSASGSWPGSPPVPAVFEGGCSEHGDVTYPIELRW